MTTMMMQSARGHHFISKDEGLACLVCGAYYCDSQSNWPSLCSGRTDLIHPGNGDASSHSLDNCAAFDAAGDCSHLAYTVGCDCSLCQS